MPAGGHFAPISTEGHKEEWKKAQKKPKNNITSDTINNKKPFLRPVRIANVWSPLIVASFKISKNQPKALITVNRKPIKKNQPPKCSLCI